MPWTARVCRSDQPTYTECCSQTKCEKPASKSFINRRPAPYLPSHVPASTVGVSCMQLGDYSCSSSGWARAARLDTAVPHAHLINMPAGCKQGGARVHKPCSSNSTREDGTSEAHHKMKRCCGLNHTATWFVLHKAGWAGGSQQRSPDSPLVSADLGQGTVPK